MCPACILTIGGGMIVAKKFGVNNVLIIGLVTLIFTYILDIYLRKMNHDKVFIPYQRVFIPIALIFIAILVAKFLL